MKDMGPSFNGEDEDEDQSVGRTISEVISKRVIILVLFIIVFTPPLTYFEPAGQDYFGLDALDYIWDAPEDPTPGELAPFLFHRASAHPPPERRLLLRAAEVVVWRRCGRPRGLRAEVLRLHRHAAARVRALERQPEDLRAVPPGARLSKRCRARWEILRAYKSDNWGEPPGTSSRRRGP